MTDQTRDRLIDAAELVFARDGFEKASLRAIMRLAEANPAAVHYHFGGKDGLLEAVLDRTVGPIAPRRLALLDQLRASHTTGPLPARGLVEAFIRPDFEAIAELQRRGPGRAAVVGRAYGQPTDHVRALMYRQFNPVATVFFPLFEEALPDVDPEVVRWRLRWCLVGVIVAMFANADTESDPGPAPGTGPDLGPDAGPIGSADPEAAIARTIDFVTAGLEAPMS